MSLSNILNSEVNLLGDGNQEEYPLLDCWSSAQLPLNPGGFGQWNQGIIVTDSFSPFPVAPNAPMETSFDINFGGFQPNAHQWNNGISSSAPLLNPQVETDWPGAISSSDTQAVDSEHTETETSTASSPESSPSPGDKVCYGMIYHVEVKLIGDGENLLSRLRDGDNDHENGIRIFNPQIENDIVMLKFPDGMKLGYPDTEKTKVLCKLLSWEDLEFQAIAGHQNLCRRINVTDKSGEAKIHVDINIYGPRHKSSEVGDVLTEHHTWLQSPGHRKKQFAYENPHVIRFPEFNETIQLEELENEAFGARPRKKRDIMEVVSEVQASTHRADQLERVTADNRLKTPLLEHQEKALAFMLQRESGDIPDEFRLWRPAVYEGQNIFIHCITNTRSPIRPDEKGGGVLADEMGMGKTLSVLVLVSKTIDEGKEWAQKNNDNDIGQFEVENHAHSTLIIVPSELLINSWLAEIDEHFDNALKVIKYHGVGRNRDTRYLATADIVLTTYKTLATDYTRKNSTSPLHKMSWFRVVLDEAHNIRRTSTTFHRACAKLHARSRWCLTGTPIQNRLEDIGALFVFLKAEPFQTMARFRGYLVMPFEQNDEEVAVERLVKLYDSLVLRRTKDILHLPGQEEIERRLTMSEFEKNQYERTKEVLRKYIFHQVGESEATSKFGLFQVRLQLRLLCNHGTHQNPFSWRMNHRNLLEETDAILAEIGANDDRLCAGCGQPRPVIDFNDSEVDFVEKCTHFYCQSCLEYIDASRISPSSKLHCPRCSMSRKMLKNARSQPEPTSLDADGDVLMGESNERVSEPTQPSGGYFKIDGFSTKMDALVKDVKATLSEQIQHEDGTMGATKSIIFSCWTRTLDLIGIYLERERIEFLRIDGDCAMSKRQRILTGFGKEGGCRIMLMTTGTGAYGLNLTAANRVFIVELQWNPSVENQAIARAIRLRQRDKVVVTRYIMERTVEQEMRSQQLAKERAAKAGFDK